MGMVITFFCFHAEDKVNDSSPLGDSRIEIVQDQDTGVYYAITPNGDMCLLVNADGTPKVASNV